MDLKDFLCIYPQYILKKKKLKPRLISLTPNQDTTMIPYTTVQDASVALGRNLTWFETVWFDYSATKSNFYVYCHTILLLFLVFSLAPLPLVFVELTGRFDRFKIQPKVKYSLSDMFRCYKDVMQLFFIVVGTLQLVSYPSLQVNFFFFVTSFCV